MSSHPISVVVPSMRGWPVMRRSLDALMSQVRAAGGQLIVADGSGLPAPADIAGAPDIVWLSMPGTGVVDLRQAGYARTEAPIIAVTEDHCSPAPDWVDSVIAAHADNPDAAMIFGTVENGTPDHVIDRALYCVGYGSWAPPLAADTKGNPGHANVSWKRWAFERVKPEGDRRIEFRFNQALRDSGERVVADASLRVHHYQCDGVAETARILYHNGRLIAGLRRLSMGPDDWLRAVAPALVAGLRTMRTLRTARSKQTLRGIALRCTPYIALLHLVHATGEAIGYVSGPGDSAHQLH